MDSKTIEVEINLDSHKEIALVAKAIGIKVEELAMIAINRIVDEYQQTGRVIQDRVHSVPMVDPEGNDHPLTIYLNEAQFRVMGDLAEEHAASIEQMAKYGLFNAGLPIERIEGDKEAVLKEIRYIRKPDECFEALHGDAAKMARKMIEAEGKTAAVVPQVH